MKVHDHLTGPDVVARHDSVARRSRKGRTTFRLIRRARATVTSGSSFYCDDALISSAHVIGRDEPSLVHAADAWLANHGVDIDAESLALTDRPWLQGRRGEVRPQVFGGRAWRGIDGYRMPIEDRRDAWCQHHDEGAERCSCAISREAAPCVLANVGGGYGATDTTIADSWSVRARVRRNGRNVPSMVEQLVEGSRGVASVYGVIDGATTHLLSWSDRGAFVGTRHVMIGRRSRVQPTTRAARRVRANRTMAQRAARKVAQEHAEITDYVRSLIADLVPNSAMTLRCGVKVACDARGLITVTRPNGDSTRSRRPNAMQALADALISHATH